MRLFVAAWKNQFFFSKPIMRIIFIIKKSRIYRWNENIFRIGILGKINIILMPKNHHVILIKINRAT
ncbi:hypothetical protein QR66_03245 [Chromobacterium piscinae]|nr:hypothetical protein QR66_03245 [Chromobacterium piscinae]